MKEIIDISVGLHDDIPCWPGSVGFRLQQTSHLSPGKCSNNSRIECDVHIGTHIDAPWHFLDDGITVEQLDLNKFIGPACIVDVTGVSEISAAVLEQIDRPKQTKRLLLKTDNSSLWSNPAHEFQKDYVALTKDGAEWIVEHDIELVGIDYLSIQKFHDPFDTHEILLQQEVVIVEGLNLAQVEAGEYEFICLPVKINGADGAPARAILTR